MKYICKIKARKSVFFGQDTLDKNKRKSALFLQKNTIAKDTGMLKRY